MEKKNPERVFLHDVASPLTTLQLNLESTIMILEDGGATSETESVKMIQNCLGQVKKMAELIRARREILIQEQGK